jgi:hypothetical protein
VECVHADSDRSARAAPVKLGEQQPSHRRLARRWDPGNAKDCPLCSCL